LALLVGWHVLVSVSYWLSNQLYFNDLGHESYMLFLSWHGRFFWSLYHECPHFAKHFTPTYALLVPFQALFRHILFLPILETVAVTSGAWGVAWLANGIFFRGRRRPLSPLALGVGILYLGNPYVGSIMLSHHFEGIGMPLFVWALAALANRRRRLFWALLILSLGTKEDMPLYWFVFGIWWIFFGWERAARRGRLALRAVRARTPLGLAVAGLAAAWLTIAMGTIAWLAARTATDASYIEARYAWLGDSVGAIIANILRNPLILVPPVLRTLWPLIPPLLLLPLLAPSTLLLLLPAACVMGLSSFEPQNRLLYYYSYPFIPFLCLGASLGLRRLLVLRLARRHRKPLRRAVGIILLLAGLFMLGLPTPTEGRRRVPAASTQRHRFIRESIRKHVPRDASVAAQFDLFCQVPLTPGLLPLSERNLERSEYWILDSRGFLGDINSTRFRAMLERGFQLREQGRARILVNMDGFLILRVPLETSSMPE
jgi:uncharacterized membrane protein